MIDRSAPPLLEVRDLKQHFPVRRGAFGKVVGQVRAVDGISLTISEINGNLFSAQIIPYTWENTNLRVAKTGDSVNLESDILGKYVVRLMQQDALNTTHC